MIDDLPTAAVAGDLGMEGAPVVPAVPAAPAMSPTEAASRKAEFIADQKKVDALMAGDVNATSEWRNITNSLYAPPPLSGCREELAEHLSAASGYTLSPEILQEVRDNTPIAPWERKETEALWQDRQRDPEWRARLMRGERGALKEKALIDFMLSRPVRDIQP
jgi:hypothetical protein